MKKYEPGQLLVKKWTKQGIAFRFIGPGAYTNANIVFLTCKDKLIYIESEESIYRAKNVVWAKVMSQYGIVFFPIQYLMTIDEHERESDFKLIPETSEKNF